MNKPCERCNVKDCAYLNRNLEGSCPTVVWYVCGWNDAIEKACEFLQDRIAHTSIAYLMTTKYLIEDLKKAMEE